MDRKPLTFEPPFEAPPTKRRRQPTKAGSIPPVVPGVDEDARSEDLGGNPNAPDGILLPRRRGRPPKTKGDDFVHPDEVLEAEYEEGRSRRPSARPGDRGRGGGALQDEYSDGVEPPGVSRTPSMANMGGMWDRQGMGAALVAQRAISGLGAGPLNTGGPVVIPHYSAKELSIPTQLRDLLQDKTIVSYPIPVSSGGTRAPTHPPLLP